MIFADRNAFSEEYECIFSHFDEKESVIVYPNSVSNGRLVLKPMYFGIFPELEKHLLGLGYSVAYVDSVGRFGREDDIKRMANFVRFVTETYGLQAKCIPIGMSAGGACAIKLAALYPELVSCLYLDNPCVNYLSCPMGYGSSISMAQEAGKNEILEYLGLTKCSILTYRKHPYDYLQSLIGYRMPAVLVYGTEDTMVPYDENERHIVEQYERAKIPLLRIPKVGCGHHPHGVPAEHLSDVLDFFEKYK